jgi:DNA-binding response OmpR family regulator
LIVVEPGMAEVPIWIVNAEHWPRAFLRAELIERGYDATGFVTLEDAVRRLRLMRAPERRPALVVLDRHEQAMDETTSEVLQSARVPVLAVADLAHPSDERRGPVVDVLHRPLTIGNIADAVDRLTRQVSHR